MQTIGLFGAMSWESGAVYQPGAQPGRGKRRGGLSSAKTVMTSADLPEVNALQELEE